MTMSIPKVSGPLGKVTISNGALGTSDACKASPTDRGALMGVSPITSMPGASNANAPAASASLAFCNFYFSWSTRIVESAVLEALNAYSTT